MRRLEDICSSTDRGIMLFWTEAQMGEFLRKAGEDAEKRERLESASHRIVFTEKVKPDKPDKPKKVPFRKKEMANKLPKPKKPKKETPERMSHEERWRLHDAKYVGKTFGELHILRYDHTENGRRFYLCHCDHCGKDMVLCGKMFRGGTTKSCGCARRKGWSGGKILTPKCK